MPSHLALGKRTEGSSEIRTVQFLGLKFHSDAATGKRVSSGNHVLSVPAYHPGAGSPSDAVGLTVAASPFHGLLTLMEDPVFFLFGSPASREAALSSARWEAVETSHGDGIIETRAKADITGWSLLGVFGYGTAKGHVDGQSFKIAEGWKPKPGVLPDYFKSDGKTKTNLFQLVH